MATAESRVRQSKAEQAEWLAKLNELVTSIRRWAEASGWQTKPLTKPIMDREVGRYEVPMLVMLRDEWDIVLSPIARPTPGQDGIVDFYLMPGYEDLFRLRFDGETWIIQNVLPRDKTAPRPVLADDERLPLSEETFRRVLNAITGHA
ncbi:MAG TPA: hypothetical protein VFT74_13365 [Isosphaeraceae bacterium]|nr:hypothetical protein [Isosphaeraceae bacterium]